MIKNPIDSQQLLGIVSEVGTAAVTLTLASSGGSSKDLENDFSGVSAEVGQYVCITHKEHAVFGQLVDVRMPRGTLRGLPSGIESVLEVNPEGTVRLLSTIDLATGRTVPGVEVYPRIGDKAYAAHPDLAQSVIEARPRDQENARGADELSFSIGSLAHAENRPVSVTPEMLFGRHCAVLGTSGAGKTWSVARIIEGIAEFRSKVILFDATGEYAKLSKGTFHVHLGTDPTADPEAKEVALPYHQLTEGDLFAIFSPRGQSQAPKLRAAMKSLKLARLAPQVALKGVIIKANKSKEFYEKEYRRHIKELEDPFATFDIAELTRQIENECVVPRRSSMEPHVWGDYSGIDQSYCTPLITRIQDIIQSPELAPIFSPRGKLSLIEVIDRFLKDKKSRVLCVSLQHLSFSHNAREIIANAAGRHLLHLAREGRFRERPLLVAVDEAHQFLNKSLGDQSSEYPLDSFELIAKEGRKFGLAICIATQRPRDIPEGVLSQMGTLVVHRLINDHDRAVVERACAGIDESAVDSLPTLAPGEAIIIGVHFPIPMSIRVKAPDCTPESHGPDYQKFWK